MAEAKMGLRERNRERTREDILRSTSVLIGENGYASTTIEHIALHAGLSRGTIYYYFPEGREQVVREAYYRTVDILLSEGTQLQRQYRDPIDRIMALATTFTSVVNTPEGRFIMVPDIMSVAGGEAGRATRSILTLIMEDLEMSRDSGRLVGDVSLHGIATVLAGAIRQIGLAVTVDSALSEPLLRSLRHTCEALLARPAQEAPQEVRTALDS